MKKFWRCLIALVLCLTLGTQSFVITALAAENVVKGQFTDYSGTSSVTVDGTTLTATTAWNYAGPGSTFEVTKKNLQFPCSINHGEMSSGEVYSVLIKDPAGQPANFAGQSFTVTATKNGSNIGSTTVALDGQAHDAIFGGTWQPSSANFISVGGSYSIGYILSNYNVFIEEDFTGTHIVGPVIVGDTASVSLGGLSTGGTYPHQVPSYVGSKNAPAEIRTDSSVPLYVGSQSQGTTFSLYDSGANRQYDDYYFTSNFVDFTTAMKAIQAEANSFSGNSVSISGNNLDVKIGGTYELTAAQLSSISTINFIGDFDAGEDTIIVCKDSGTVKLPKTMLNGGEIASIESGMNGSVVYMLPNATTVSGDAISGHIVAPYAAVSLTGGYFNGCVIAKSLSASAEGHMWTYNGKLLPTSNGFTAFKLMDGKTPSADQKFTFILEEFVNGSWKQLQTVQNVGGKITFDEIAYGAAGTHWYRIREDQTEIDGIDLTRAQFVIKDDVTSSKSGGSTVLSANTTYYKVNTDSSGNPVGVISGSSIDTSKLTTVTAGDVGFKNYTAVPETIDISGSKTWNDNNNQDGKRPGSITVNLLADGNVVQSKTVTPDSKGNWTWSFNGLVKYDGKREIAYTITENAVSGYTTSYNGYNITNTHTVEKIDISGTKTWNDNNDQDGIRPSSITINLLDGSKNVVATKTVTAKDGWKWSFTGLDKYKNGGIINYTITENTVDGYTTVVSGYNVTNSHTAGKTSVSVTKKWEDANNQDGVRPNDVTITLYSGDTAIKTATLNKGNNWTYTFTDLDKYSKGSEIAYTVKETAVGNGYTSKVTGSAKDGFVITNTRPIETVTVTGEKTWNDNNNQDGKRPKNITINLLADGSVISSQTVSSTSNKWTFSNLPKYKSGQQGVAINYSITENEVAGYQSKVNGYNVTNSYTPGKVSIAVTKKWDDADNQDGIRPANVTVVLVKNGEATGSTVTLNSANKWSASFNDLDEYSGGQKINYTIKEVNVSGYTSAISGDMTNGYVITNKHTPETTSVTVTKEWSDNNNQDGKRPGSITVRLRADGEVVQSKTVTSTDGWTCTFDNLPKFAGGKQIKYTITEDEVAGYQSIVDGFKITNSYTPGKVSVSVSKVWSDDNNRDGIRPASVTVRLLCNGAETGKTLVLNEGNKWADSFTELDEYTNGNKNVYTVEENAVNGYNTVVSGNAADGFVITNSHNPEMIKVEGSKTWDDADNQDGKRPSAIYINLYANGTSIKTLRVTKDNGWKWSFDNLYKYENGKLVTYSIIEDEVDGYAVSYNGYNVTNSYTPGKISVSVSKAWDDNNNQDGRRYESVQIALYANGKSTGKSITLYAGNNWAGAFNELDEFISGKKIEYTVQEIKPENDCYHTEITGNVKDGFVVTNSYTPETVKVEGSKTWDDANNQDGKRPASITVNLLADGKQIDSQIATEANGWKWSFANLAKFANGKLINYTITENEVAGYQSKVSGYNVTNSYTPGKVNVSVTKAWEDDNNRDGIRPGSIEVILTANGEATESVLTLSAANNWSGSFTDLDEYANGEKIVYDIEEINVDGYTKTKTGNAADGFIITNSHNPATVKVAGAKTWDDANNQDGKRPESITINLLADGSKIDSVSVTAEDGWKWSFENLKKFEAGKAITYSITEDITDDYTATYDGFNVTNTYTPGKVSVPVQKVWNDNNNQDGKRPESVTVVLVKNGAPTSITLTLSDENGWAGSFTDLDEYTSGNLNVYSVKELTVEGYTSNAVKSGDGYTITNTHNTSKIEISGTKTWDDAKNQDGKRPESITVNLLADGKKVNSAVATEKTGWAYSFTGLDEYANGVKINYTIEETPVAGYTATYDGFNITNTHEIEKIAVSGAKTWVDNDNAAGKRPASITINLFADGKKVTSKTVTADDNWQWSFKNQPKYDNGKEIVYTITEDAVERYVSEVDGYNVINRFKSMTVEKTDGLAEGTKAVAGQIIYYTITVTNTGAAKLTNVVVTDDHNGEFSANPKNGISVSADGRTATIAEIEAGSSVAVTFAYTVAESDIVKATGSEDPATLDSKIINKATATDGEITEEDTEETPTGYKKIALSKVADITRDAIIGTEITYNIKVKNTGNIDLTNVMVEDALVNGKLAESTDSEIVIVSDRTAKLTSLKVGETKELTYKYTVTKADVESETKKIVNVVTAKVENLEETAEATTTTKVLEPAIALTKYVCDAPDGSYSHSTKVNAGETVWFKLEVTNCGQSTLKNVTISDEFIRESMPHDPIIMDAWHNILGRIPSEMAPGDVWTSDPLPYEIPKSTKDGEKFINTATVTADDTVDSTKHVSAEDTAEASAIRNFSLDLTKSVNTDKVVPGMHIVYTIIVKNTGDATLYNVNVNDDKLRDEGFGTWPKVIDVLEPDAAKVITQEYIVPDTAIAGEQIINYAKATAENPDHPGQTIEDDGQVPVDVIPFDQLPEKDKPVINKLVNGVKEYEADGGETVRYTFYVSNYTKIDYKNLVVYDPMLGAVKTIAELKSGDVWSVTDNDTTYLVPAETPAGTNIDNTVYLFRAADYDESEPDVKKAFDSSDAKVIVNSNPSLNIDKACAVEVAEVGDEVTFTVSVTNDGNCTLTDLVVSDIFEGTWVLPEDNDNLSIGENNTVVIAKLEQNGSEAFSFKYIVPEGAKSGDVINNTASVTADNPAEPGKKLTDDDDAGFGVVASVIEVIKTADRDEAMEGDEVVFFITVNNTGDTVLNNVNVTDTRDVTVDGIAYAAGEVIYTIETMQPGDSVSFETSYTVTAQDVEDGVVYNTATAEADNGAKDSSTDNFNAVETPVADFSITKAANTEKADVGSTVTYNIIVANTGTAVLKNIEVTDSLDVAYNGKAYAAGTVIKTIESLDPGKSESITVSYVVPESEEGKTITNTATAKPEGEESKSDSCDVEVNIINRPGFKVNKTANVTGAYSGDKVNYYITVANTGNCELTNLTLSDDMLGFECVIPIIKVGETWSSVGKYDLSYIVPDSDKEAMLYNIAVFKGDNVEESKSEPAAVTNRGRVLGDTDQMIPNTGDMTTTKAIVISAFAFIISGLAAFGSFKRKGNKFSYR